MAKEVLLYMAYLYDLTMQYMPGRKGFIKRFRFIVVLSYEADHRDHVPCLDQHSQLAVPNSTDIDTKLH